MSMIARSARRGQRKSPFKHHVKSHVRSGIQIGGYERGKGRRPKQTTRPRRTGGKARGLKPFPSRFKVYDVSIRFVTGGSESINNLDATSFPVALTKGLTKRERTDIPKSILVRRNPQ